MAALQYPRSGLSIEIVMQLKSINKSFDSNHSNYFKKLFINPLNISNPGSLYIWYHFSCFSLAHQL